MAETRDRFSERGSRHLKVVAGLVLCSVRYRDKMIHLCAVCLKSGGEESSKGPQGEKDDMDNKG